MIWVHTVCTAMFDDTADTDNVLPLEIKKKSAHCVYTIFSMKYLVMRDVYTDVGGIRYSYHVCPPVCKIIHSLKLVDYHHVQADNLWYNYYIYWFKYDKHFISGFNFNIRRHRLSNHILQVAVHRNKERLMNISKACERYNQDKEFRYTFKLFECYVILHAFLSSAIFFLY